jgi:hypothetical protein
VTYKILDLFGGTESMMQAFHKSRDWETFNVDLNPEDEDLIEPDLQADVAELSVSDLPHDDWDVIWASPPCKAFSLAAAHHHMDDDVQPKTDFGRKSIELVRSTLELVDEIDPTFWFMENPRAGMRRVMREKEWGEGEPTGTVSLCQYGADRMKPTDLWGEHPDSMKYRFCANGEDCHESASRGSKTGTQGIELAIDRAQFPFGLSLAVLEAVEREL